MGSTSARVYREFQTRNRGKHVPGHGVLVVAVDERHGGSGGVNARERVVRVQVNGTKIGQKCFFGSVFLYLQGHIYYGALRFGALSISLFPLRSSPKHPSLQIRQQLRLRHRE